MSVFRYFANEVYARAFLEEGEVRLCTLATYHVIEDGEVRGDPNDGLLRYKPNGGVTLNKAKEVIKTNLAFVSIVQVNDIFVYCMSQHLSEELAERFNCPFCVEIESVARLVGRIRRAARLRSQLDNKNVLAGPVDYRSEEKEPGADWALPERLAFMKPEAFAWQDEFRIVVGNKGALGAQNVQTFLEREDGAHGIKHETREPLILPLGDLTRIGKLHSF